MRDIKFRAWHHGGGDPRVKPYMRFSDSNNELFWGCVDNEPHVAEVMQFTGLVDKHGVEIWEGDLLKNVTGRIGKVVWHNPSASFDTDFVKETRTSFESSSYGFVNNMWGNHTEVIGNIWANPELMEGNND